MKGTPVPIELSVVSDSWEPPESKSLVCDCLSPFLRCTGSPMPVDLYMYPGQSLYNALNPIALKETVEEYNQSIVWYEEVRGVTEE